MRSSNKFIKYIAYTDRLRNEKGEMERENAAVRLNPRRP